MPPRAGAKPLNISLSDQLEAQLVMTAAKPEFGTKSAVIEAALAQMFESSANEALLVTVQQQASLLRAELMQGLQDQSEQLSSLVITQRQLAQQVASLPELERQLAKRLPELAKAVERLSRQVSEVTQSPPTLWQRLCGRATSPREAVQS